MNNQDKVNEILNQLKGLTVYEAFQIIEIVQSQIEKIAKL